VYRDQGRRSGCGGAGQDPRHGLEEENAVTRTPTPKERKKLPLGALDDEPDTLDVMLHRFMPKALTIKELAAGAKQKRRDNYKWNCLSTMINLHGMRPPDKVMVGSLDKELATLTDEEIDKRLRLLEADRAALRSAD
jgi:hypothetical protein